MVNILILMKSSSAAPSPNWGSLMHGMLIEHLSGHWPSLLHSESVHPVSQWVEVLGRDRLRWHLNILDDHLGLCFLELCHVGDIWYCQHNGSRLTIEQITSSSLSLRDYITRCLDGPARSSMLIRFMTATTHKSQKKYVLFPTPELIGNNLRNRLTKLDESLSFPDEHLAILTDRAQIVQYQLKTTTFQLEGSKIDGYTGHVLLRFSGPDEIVRFGNLLFGLSEWFGVGIKTALGMGGCLLSHA